MVFVRGAVPGDRVRARVDEVEALVRPRPTRSSCSSRAPTGSSRRRRTRARRGRCSPTSASSRRRRRRCATRSSASAASRRRRSSRSCPRSSSSRYRNKLEYSFGEDERRRAGARLPPPRPLRPDRRRDGRHPRLRARRRGARGGQGVVPRGGPHRVGPRDQSGVLRNLVVREGRRTGQLQARVVTSPGASSACDELAAATPADCVPLDARRGRGRDHARRRDEGRSRGRPTSRRSCPACASASRRTPSSRPTPRWPSVLYGAATSSPGSPGRERVLDLFCGIGTIALVLALDAGEVWGVELVEEAVADAIENAKLNGVDNAQLLRRRRAAGDARRCSSSRASPTSWWWTRRAPGSRRRSCAASSRRRRSGSSTCRATRRRSRRTRASSSDGGYELKTVRPVDMFPQTPHIECVALLERASPALARPRRARPPRWRARVQRNGPPVSSAALISASVSFAPHSAQRALDDGVDAARLLEVHSSRSPRRA